MMLTLDTEKRNTFRKFAEIGEMGRWGDGEMGRWGDGEMGRWGNKQELIIF
ncbi:MAG: hypothetical protein F6K41_23490, partial [Symploca sp. SIO3E6]|nr:hypothetical protein [Caldora sp. SIO3E6]